MFPIFTLFSDIIANIKTGNYKQAACSAGRVISQVTCSTQAELCATARPKALLAGGETDPDAPEPEPCTQAELYEACAAFGDELKAACEHSEHVCRMGAASDHTLSPGMWDTIKAFLLDILRQFISKPADWAPAPLPAPATVATAATTLEEITGKKPELPKLSKPSERKPAEKPKEDEDTTGESTSEGDGDEGDAEPPKPAPAPKPAAPKPKPKT